MRDQSKPPDKPLISVVMPVYNAERYVGAAIESILQQTYSHFEMIVVDDGSTDSSPVIISELAQRDQRVRLRSVPHGGTAKALNAGVQAAVGDYIAMLDSDDLALPERLAVQMDWMGRTGVDLCGSCVQRFQGNDRLIWFPESHAAICAELVFRCAMLPSTILARASVLKENPYQAGIIGEDYELWTRLAPRYRLGNVQRILVRYRMHSSQKSVTQGAEVALEARHYQNRYFTTLFPDATPDECEAVAFASMGRPHRTLSQLEQAGRWLVRLADMPDTFARAQMARRWLTACRRAAPLGMPCFRTFQKIAVHFPPLAPHSILALWLVCAARIPPDSRVVEVLRWLRQKARGQSHASA